MATSIFWFRSNLRLADQPALEAAVRTNSAIVPVFIWSPEEEAPWAPGAASRWWLHQSLKSLAANLEARGSRLIVRRGPTRAAFESLLRETGATQVFWGRRYEPNVVLRDRQLKTWLKDAGIAAESHNASLLFEPWELATKEGKPFQVFTPYWNACLRMPAPAAPTLPPKRLPAPDAWPDSLRLDELELEPRVDWAVGLRKAWSPGEAGARRLLDRFFDQALERYKEARDRPDEHGTSRLSPHLHFGEISPRQIWSAVAEWAQSRPDSRIQKEAEHYLREVGWREFAHHLLFHFPHTAEQPLRGDFERFPWRADAAALQAWQKGRTGYPLVDAGMRELWSTGWMHNRVRMIAASFLVKHLRQRWQEGAAWFWDTLVDADLANNTLGWQWTAGCGADAAPYFRIFNPMLQGEKFDPAGAYVRKWLPELAKLDAKWLHQPWKAPKESLRQAGVELGRTYPAPMVDHAEARAAALAAFDRFKAQPQATPGA